MSKTETNTYSSEFKESAVNLAIESDRPVAETARELGINKNTLHTWISKYSKSAPGKNSRSDGHLYDELKRLKKENTRLKEERDILKKATTYFAKEAR